MSMGYILENHPARKTAKLSSEFDTVLNEAVPDQI
jgi:hypothetical protein